MAEFLTTRNISASITDIIRKADQEIGLVCPYIRFADQVAERLLYADRKGKNIVVVYGKEELREDTRELLSELQNLQLFYSDNLHAKCYFNEHELVLTSMNLYAFSERNNWEMGVKVDSSEELYESAVDEVESIVHNAEQKSLVESSNLDLEKLFGGGTSTAEVSSSETEEGYCIRCKETIPHDSDRPLCGECFQEWKKWENEEYEEKYCHTCGDPHETSMDRPQCKPCWSDTR
jgi:D-Tyr-tRNAtyr deacylase